MATALVFEVVARSKSEKVTREGHLETTFRVILQTSNGNHKLTLTDENSSLLAKYPLQSNVPVSIGKSDQLNLVSEEQLKKEMKKAADASAEEEPAR